LDGTILAHLDAENVARLHPDATLPTIQKFRRLS
jgi:hypothetical protein